MTPGGTNGAAAAEPAARMKIVRKKYQSARHTSIARRLCTLNNSANLNREILAGLEGMRHLVFWLSLFYHDAISIVLPPSTSSDITVINRRHALGLLTAASILPTRSFANVSYQRSEFRDDLAKRFFDLGTTAPSSPTRWTIT